ncbi:hypothetical protein TNCV_4450201 [Trichonephila clavipes]|nr:hypothetical protein TNCV_4450201 [Trichonephila clavipes]
MEIKKNALTIGSKVDRTFCGLYRQNCVLKWLVTSLPMILTILVAFDTSLDQVMPSILHLRKPSLFHRHAGLRLQNHRS